MRLDHLLSRVERPTEAGEEAKDIAVHLYYMVLRVREHLQKLLTREDIERGDTTE